jgi:hypothetical protein
MACQAVNKGCGGARGKRKNVYIPVRLGYTASKSVTLASRKASPARRRIYDTDVVPQLEARCSALTAPEILFARVDARRQWSRLIQIRKWSKRRKKRIVFVEERNTEEGISERGCIVYMLVWKRYRRDS